MNLTTGWTLTVGRSQENAEDGEECGPLAAFGCLRALSTVLETVSSLPHLMPQVMIYSRGVLLHSVVFRTHQHENAVVRMCAAAHAVCFANWFTVV